MIIYALFEGKPSVEEVRNMVPEVVQIIKEAVTVCTSIGFCELYVLYFN